MKTCIDFLIRFSSKIDCLNGIPASVENLKVQLNPFDCKALSSLLKQNDDIAAVIIEPVPGSNPSPQTLEFYDDVRLLCDRYNVVLIADEIITGFRLVKGAVSLGRYEKVADLCVFGKALGGGLPIGVVSVGEEIRAKLFEKETIPLMGGTFSGNPIVSLVALSIHECLTDRLLHDLNEKGDRLRNTLNDKLKKNLNHNYIVWTFIRVRENNR